MLIEIFLDIIVWPQALNDDIYWLIGEEHTITQVRPKLMALAKANKFCTEDMETHWLFLKDGQGM